MFVSCECLCCQVEVSATGRSLVQRSPTDCGVCLSVIKWKMNNLDTYCEWVEEGRATKLRNEIYSMSTKIVLNYYCWNVTLCRLPPWRSIHSCSHKWKNTITHTISLGFLSVHYRIRCFKSSVLARRVLYTLLLKQYKEVSPVLQDSASGRATCARDIWRYVKFENQLAL
jgi:hypothetical protein